MPTTLEVFVARDALARLSPEEQIAFANWCADIDQPMDDAHLPALIETWLLWRLTGPSPDA